MDELPDFTIQCSSIDPMPARSMTLVPLRSVSKMPIAGMQGLKERNSRFPPPHSFS
ncbi:hypothetical protein [Ignatzschineria cameli]|uniref:hypothetical protein n=1 Tax=Ignatzschineria cameli TaxID=2182793 RepID=UPI0013004C48|nr:hypothetical protein [Ignatzschineria cameli]